MEELIVIGVVGLVVSTYQLVQRAAKHGIVGSYSLSPETRRKAQAAYKVAVRLVSVFWFVGFGMAVNALFFTPFRQSPNIWASMYTIMLIVALVVTLAGGLRSLAWGSKEIQQLSATDKADPH